MKFLIFSIQPKIQHTGDTESLDLCRKKHQYQNKQRQIKRGRKKKKEYKKKSCVICQVSRVTCHMSHIMCQVSFVTCCVSPVICHLSPVTCHLSLTPTVTATDPLPANSFIMHSRLARKDPKTQREKIRNAKTR